MKFLLKNLAFITLFERRHFGKKFKAQKWHRFALPDPTRTDLLEIRVFLKNELFSHAVLPYFLISTI